MIKRFKTKISFKIIIHLAPQFKNTLSKNPPLNQNMLGIQQTAD